jgi:hypothetical protein
MWINVILMRGWKEEQLQKWEIHLITFMATFLEAENMDTSSKANYRDLVAWHTECYSNR